MLDLLTSRPHKGSAWLRRLRYKGAPRPDRRRRVAREAPGPAAELEHDRGIPEQYRRSSQRPRRERNRYQDYLDGAIPAGLHSRFAIRGG
ncbi:MAG: hypothetical protein BJ554DRAFT_1649 [Olpidium bornovanus]|uniref:Uncharacterized protein n=1 Tax=Olpidium bornovanus TaxID=278681 RepID=A0A8H7ZSC6_9FUNG|nr:MAG: hypothetical protein BJ554DRAFT_1649 [Olpidium bornovanus]